MARDVRRREAKRFLEQAEEFLESANRDLDEKRFNVAAFNAIQAFINANDSLTVHYLEKRGSKDHREALKLHLDVVKIINDGSQRGSFKDALDLRSSAGYMGISISKKDAEKTVRTAVKFVYWVKNRVK